MMIRRNFPRCFTSSFNLIPVTNYGGLRGLNEGVKLVFEDDRLMVCWKTSNVMVNSFEYHDSVTREREAAPPGNLIIIFEPKRTHNSSSKLNLTNLQF